MKINKPGTDRAANYFMPFYNKRKEQNGIEEIIEINQGEKQDCVVEVIDCKNTLITLGLDQIKNEPEAIPFENPFENATDTVEEQTKDIEEIHSINENNIRHDINFFLQGANFIDSVVEYAGDNGNAGNTTDENVNIVKADENIAYDNKAEAERLSKEHPDIINVSNALHIEKYYSNKVDVIDILSKLIEISGKIK